MSGTEVKVCGMTNIDDAKVALDYGADYVGFVLYDKSSRGITPSLLCKITDKLPKNTKTVGVFVNESREYVEQVANDCGLYAVQLHGNECAEDFIDCPLLIWRAVWVGDVGKKNEIKSEEWKAERFVVDASVPGMYGGTGTVADWNKAATIATEHKIMLAGGLTLLNVEDAIKKVHPLGIDVASGVEREPGYKDLDKMRLFIKKVKNEQ